MGLEAMCWVFVMLVFLVSVESSVPFNLFIGQQEVKKLLGLNAELYYVRDGVVNTYAMNFVVPVPANLSEIAFSWQALARQPLKYSAALQFDNEDALVSPPRLDIPMQGLLPAVIKTFRLQVECSGSRSAEVRLMLQLNVSGAASSLKQHEPTIITFRRNKICLKGSPPRSASHLPATTPPPPPPPAAAASAPLAVLPIALGGAAAVLVLLGASVAGALGLRSAKRNRDTASEASYASATAYGSSPHVFIRLQGSSVGQRGPPSVAGSYATIASFQKLPLSALQSTGASPYHVSPVQLTVSSVASSPVTTARSLAAGRPTPQPPSYYSQSASMVSQGDLESPHRDPRNWPDVSERLRQLASVSSPVSTGSVSYVTGWTPSTTGNGGELELRGLLMEGTFGRVYSATLGGSKPVVVKTVTAVASALQRRLLLAEGSMLHGLRHQNILPVLALLPLPATEPDVTSQQVAPLAAACLVYPASAHGNLKLFLQGCRLHGSDSELSPGSSGPLTPQDVVHLALQATLALMFLHDRGLCHRDLAARNCVLDERLRLRVADSALSRDLFPHDYHCLGDNENRPVRWMALETLLHAPASPAADVWSLGVLIWELATLAMQPYAEVDPFEMADFLRDGYRLAQPLNCPDQLFCLVASCWRVVPAERPSCSQLRLALQDLYTQLGRFV